MGHFSLKPVFSTLKTKIQDGCHNLINLKMVQNRVHRSYTIDVNIIDIVGCQFCALLKCYSVLLQESHVDNACYVMGYCPRQMSTTYKNIWCSNFRD